MAQKKRKFSEKENAEKKYRALIEKRDELNELANQTRSERNTLNDEKKSLRDPAFASVASATELDRWQRIAERNLRS